MVKDSSYKGDNLPLKMKFSTKSPLLKKMSNRIKMIIAVIVCLMLLAVAVLFYTPTTPAPDRYDPSIELPDDYIVLVEEPQSMEDLTFIAALSSIVVHNGYHPMFILDDGKLDQHQLWTMSYVGIEELPVLLFTDNEDLTANLQDQVTINENHTFPKDPAVLAKFKGFEDVITVGSYQEALWVAPLANVENKVITVGPSSYNSQEEVWDRLSSLGVEADYVIVTNPYDLTALTLEENIADYDPYDTQYHIPSLSVVAAEMAAYHQAYVMTSAPPRTDEIGIMDTALNSRSIGYYMKLKEFAGIFGMPEYICIVGSAAAVPQFQLPGNGDGDVLVSSDVIFGFLDEDKYTMDSAVGRIVNLNIQGASNQLVRTFLYENYAQMVTVEYSDIAGGTQDVDWRHHGASFSGYEITYKRMQATPARWMCEDYTDENMEYEYYGPSGTGELVGDGAKNSDERDIAKICEASGLVAYRGHGSDTGSLYSLRVYADSEQGQLSGERASTLDLPPQVSFFAACMNGKIHGTDFGEDAADVELNKLFCLNYLYGGAIALGGATEVSYSNVAQDVDSLWAEYGLGILHSDEDHEWDLNNAWYAFFWDGILNHEGDYGTVGKAIQWTENRYIKNHNNEISPFDQTTDSDLGAHWKSVAMYVLYGDPAFKPYVTSDGQNGYDPWHNGPDDF